MSGMPFSGWSPGSATLAIENLSTESRRTIVEGITTYGARWIFVAAELDQAVSGVRIGVSRATSLPFDLRFAIKCNPNLDVLKALAQRGLGFECSFPREVGLVHLAGGQGTSVVYSPNIPSPVPDSPAGVRLCVSLSELSGSLRWLAGRDLWLRIGVPGSRFGISLQDVPRIVEELSRVNARVCGFQVHYSSIPWPPTPSVWVERAEIAVEAARAAKVATEAVEVSLGGTFSEPDGANYAQVVCDSVRSAAAVVARALPQARLSIEPGRLLVQNAGHLFARCEYTDGDGTARLTCGLSTLASITSSTGMVVVRSMPSLEPTASAGAATTLLGPSSREEDSVGVTHQQIKPGDVVEFTRVGAYQMAFANEFAETPPGVSFI